jgi:osmoprotectant transport system permease protein
MFRLIEHLQLAFYSLILALAVGILIGIFISKYTKLAIPIISVAGILDTIPSLAILSVLIPLVGIGKPPAIITLFLYSLMPIIRNTYVGIREINPAIIEAAEGMGMTEMQILIKVRLPLALPVIMAGIRTAGVLLVGIATIASLIGAGGLGEILFLGITSMNIDLILAGAIPVAFLAVITEIVLGRLEKAMIPRGLKK